MDIERRQERAWTEEDMKKRGWKKVKGIWIAGYKVTGKGIKKSNKMNYFNRK